MGIMRVFRFFLLFFLVSLLGFSQDENQNLESSSVIEFIEHKVKRKQTLYTISNLYDVPINLIKQYNPSIKGDKISKKMVLKIPFITTAVLEESIKEIVEKVLVSTRTNRNLFDSVPKKKSIKFGFIAPFNLNKIEIDSIENTKKYLEKLNLSTLSLDFYSGVLTALETVKKLGIKTHIDVYDNKNSFDEIDKLSYNKNINSYDFILGPFIPRNLNRLSLNLKDSKVPIVSPLTSKKIQINKNVFQSVPSIQSQRELMFTHVDSLIIKDPDPCVMIIYDRSTELVKEKLLKRFPYAELIDTDLTMGLVDPEITDSLLVEKKNNLVFLESQNLNVITSVSSLLNSQISKERNINLLSTYRSETYENENISYQQLGNLNFTYPSYFIPYYGDELNELNALFIENFGKLPNKIALRGYEITLDLILRTAHRRKLVKSIDLGETSYFQNRFDYVNKEQGYINQSVFLVKHDDLEVLEITSEK
ncbi:LysM peptidoglycan-binding domain-containing protein [Flavobacteriaceae bacterium]|nr:LysM peptidoglycan-binding domain-containing protein [Flavobacteriaceae bacterium]MDB4007498.1 LysM peptidoglycan-binding domain-containing protein [Flavobacteriaceae bacterium]MDB4014139.1 LysM peptidoglycan-binding domain-containing protein [Flavobacteriaceae bacterium]MDB4131132.1 LysM peptidoglycan-binding domain-containing protein [Flavobacteriaceae bacterium]